MSVSEPALLLAATIGKVRIIQEAISDQNVNIDCTDIMTGNTPLIISAARGYVNILELLIHAGAHLNIQNHGYARTALMISFIHRHPDIAQVLVNEGARVDLVDSNGMTALMVNAAASHNLKCDTDLVETLIHAGTDMDIRNRAGWTALMHCAMQGKVNTAQILVEAGANLDIRNDKGEAAVHIAARYDQFEVLEVLIDAGADISVRTMGDGEIAKNYDIIRSKYDEISETRKDFLNVMKSEKTSSWNRSRLMFVGEGKAGKSSLVRSLLGLPFESEWNSTIGAEISNTVTSQSGWHASDIMYDNASKLAARIVVENGITISSEIKKSNDRSTSMIDEKIANKAFTGTNEDIESKSEKKNFRRNTSGCQNSSIKGSPKQNKKFGVSKIFRKFKRQLIYESKKDKDALTLSMWDFGGQEVFYSMHHIFLTETGVYVLVFDMRELFEPKTRQGASEYILFWLRSIRLHAPGASLLLVGTFLKEILEQPKESSQVIEKTLKALVGDGFPQIIANAEEELIYFPIDNKFNLGINNLREAIEQTIRKDASISQQVSVDWMLLLDHILSESKRVSYLNLSDVRAAAEEIGIRGATEIESALKLFHEKGMILHLTATNVLKRVVVVKPQWLVENISKIIRDQGIHAFDEYEFEKAGILTDLNLTFEEGLASQDFLEYVWRDTKQYDFFLDVMKRTMLLSEWSFSKDKMYLIPSLLCNASKEQISNLADRFRCIFDFSDSFLPNGLFQRLVCLLTAMEGFNIQKRKRQDVKEPVLYANFVSMQLEEGYQIVLVEDKGAQIINFEVQSAFKAAEYVTIVTSMLEKINYDVMSKGLKWKVLFENPNNREIIGEDRARRKQIYPWFDKEYPVMSFNEKISLESFLDFI